MSKSRRSIVILASALAISSGALILTSHAADQASPPAGAQPAAAKPTAPAAKSPAPGAPQVPEESATIRDDPTIAPDPKQSADNSVSFPNDT
jgi:hypothetical protein